MNIVGFIGNLAGGDMIIILALALMFFGAKRLPELARGLGQAVSEFNRAKDDVHRQLTATPEPTVQTPQGIQEHRTETTAPAVQQPHTEPHTDSVAAAPVQQNEVDKPQV